MSSAFSCRARVWVLVIVGAATCPGLPTAVGQGQRGTQSAAAAWKAEQLPNRQEKQRTPRGKQGKKPYEPEFGQEGKNVIWVPTADSLVERMLDMAQVSPNDYVIDLGSGDGRTVIAAAKRGARAHGIEFNADMVEFSKRRAEAAGVAGRATFEKADLFETDLSKATVVTLFLMEWINVKLRPKLLQLKPGTRVVSNTFAMADWLPDEAARVTHACEHYCTALLWVVPAQVAGTWQLSPGRLHLTQAFQHVSGKLAAWGTTTEIAAGRMRGDRLTFTVRGSEYEAVLKGDTLEGTITTGKTKRPFRATKVPEGT